VTTPDSIHLATAIIWKVECFYTFDGKDKAKKARALLPLNGNVAGRSLAILSAPAKSAIVRATFKKPKRAKLVFSKSYVQLRVDTDSQSFLPPT